MFFFMKKIIDAIRNLEFSRLSIYVIIIVCLATLINVNKWTNKNAINGDAISYYAYLPALFIHHDLSLVFIDKNPEKYSNRFWPSIAPNGSKIIKTTAGIAFCFAPFFFIGHIAAYLSNSPLDGFSLPYRASLFFSGVVFLFIGLLYLRRSLRMFFNDAVTSITLLIIVLGTNLFYYTALEPLMSHVYSFSFLAVLIYQTILFYQHQSYKTTIIIGITLAIITLIRPTNLIFILLPICYGITNTVDFKIRFTFFKENFKFIFCAILCFIILWIPQLLYWKMLTGYYFFNSYGEKFYFDNPHIMDGLFGFRKGWFIYTPLMMLGVIGLFFLYKNYKRFIFSFSLVLIIEVYVVLSWWCWWYGGSFGMRTFIDIYALLAFPMAAVFALLFSKTKWLRFVFAVVLLYFVSLNLFQTYQYKLARISWDSMTKDAYLKVFMQLDDKPETKKLMRNPDYKAAMMGLEER